MNCGAPAEAKAPRTGRRCRLLGCWRDPAVKHCRFKRCLRAGGERYGPAPRSSPAKSAPRQNPLKAEKAGTWSGLFSAPPVPLHPWSRLKHLLAVGLQTSGRILDLPAETPGVHQLLPVLQPVIAAAWRLRQKGVLLMGVAQDARGDAALLPIEDRLHLVHNPPSVAGRTIMAPHMRDH